MAENMGESGGAASDVDWEWAGLDSGWISQDREKDSDVDWESLAEDPADSVRDYVRATCLGSWTSADYISWDDFLGRLKAQNEYEAKRQSFLNSLVVDRNDSSQVTKQGRHRYL